MRKYQNIRLLILIMLGTVAMLSCSGDLLAQTKKNKVRLNADYVKVIGKEHYLNIKSSARIDKKTVEVSGIELSIFQELEDEQIELGKTLTNHEGKSKFNIENFDDLQPDSTGVYSLKIIFSGNEEFKKASRSISFKNAHIEAGLVTRDSTNYVSAKLIDSSLDSIVSDAELTVQVDRLFRPLTIGEEFYTTDENGEIEVEIEDGIPGVDGILTLYVVLQESDDFGTVKAVFQAPVGKLIIDESTFDQRTMWSPNGKTPIFLMVIIYGMLFSVWGIILYLCINLFRIVKS